ncbi:MAG: 50S ribosomal protein L22 [Pseudomonadota bacterium]|nr:50S ribosomal protein L22 [Pseudomonadota bacterium]
MQVQAKLRHFRMAPRKVRLVTDMIKGMDVERAINTLQVTGKKCAPVLRKLVESAVASADQRGDMDIDSLYISRAFVDEGPTMRRFQPRAMGRATRINKRSSHVTVILDDERY